MNWASELKEVLVTFYGIQVTKLTPVLGGADLDATTYKAMSGTNSYFVKLKRGVYNPVIFELLNEAEIRKIIQPIKTLDGHTVQLIGDSYLMVFPFVTGKTGFEVELSSSQWIDLGETLKQIHSVVISPEMKQMIRTEDYSPKWRNMARSLCSQPEILRLVDRAEELSEEVQKRCPPLVLCHSDIHAGNLLITETGEFYIVDWDGPVLAPKERDLMFIGGGVGGVWNQPFEAELFYQGYGPTDVDSVILAFYRCERIVEDIAIYAQNPETMHHYVDDMFKSGNVVEMALLSMCIFDNIHKGA